MQLVWLVKEVALTLNAHFPGRLAALWVVDAPTVIKWPLQALRKLLHPATGQKLHTCSASDAVLPLSLAELPPLTPGGQSGKQHAELPAPALLQCEDGVHFWYV